MGAANPAQGFQDQQKYLLGNLEERSAQSKTFRGVDQCLQKMTLGIAWVGFCKNSFRLDRFLFRATNPRFFSCHRKTKPSPHF